MKRIDLTGRKIGRLTVLGFPALRVFSKTKKMYWLCQCECGNKLRILGESLRTGRSQSCGCLRAELLTTHGDIKSKEYIAWNNMKNRCYQPSYIQYRDYGGRGISVCSEWINSYETFLQDMGRAPSKSHSIDRIDVNGNYEPSNCHWATPREQALNKRPKKPN